MKLEPAFEAFAEVHAKGAPQLVWTRLIDDLETPVSAYLKIGHGRPYAFLFESVEGGAWRGRYSIITLKPDLVWRCHGEQAEIAEGDDIAAGRFTSQPGGALESLRELVAASRIDLPAGLPPPSAGLYGAIGYDMIRLFEHLPDINPDTLGLPDGVMTRPSVVAVFDAIAQEIILVTQVRPGEAETTAAYEAARERLAAIVADLRKATPQLTGQGAPQPDQFTSLVSREDFHGVVAKAKDYIAAGDVFQVVLSHRFRSPFARDPFSLYRSLRRTNPSPFLFYLDFGDFQMAGSSPEILVRLRDNKVTIRPLAGTRRRGATPEEDLALEAELKSDPKEIAEHLMLLDLGRNDVGRVTMLKKKGSNAPAVASAKPRVRVTDSFFVERYSHVMHLASNVEGDAPDGLDPVDVIMSALPAGTLSGAPKVRAMEIIDELEIEKRGIGYAGAAGYFGCDGSLDTCIILRTAFFKDGMMYVQAGAGIVADSDPDSEYAETLQKAAALRRAAEESWRFV
ncbi:anthranilate synthase component I [Phenylobacterium immobile]|uniref:anthranilate synthase component I n=1 Tax=Phenylobacterium immobile TaxID=21 RepID=UPI000B079CF1|nr:anthranilate synthase component I [Phenylobacterium immobile]